MYIFEEALLNFVTELFLVGIIIEQYLCLYVVLLGRFEPVSPSHGNVSLVGSTLRSQAPHGAFLGTFRFVGLYKKVLYTTV